MFLCKTCKKHYTIIRGGIGLSYGPCEECGQVGPCFDIPPRGYQAKDSIHEYRKLLRGLESTANIKTMEKSTK